MPELPEVETVRAGLSRLIVGKTIAVVDFDWPKSFPNSPADVKAFLVGAKILAVKRRAKVLMVELDSDYTLVIHLKMTGQLVFVQKQLTAESYELRARKDKGKVKAPYPKLTTHDSKLTTEADEIRFGAGHPNDSLINRLPDKSTRVIFELTDNALGQSSCKNELIMTNVRGQSSHTAKLYFNDQRKFGWIKLLPTIEVPNIDFFKKVGPEPLTDEFTAKVFIDRVKKRANTTIKAAILDQTVLAGVGNIYADESLWGAKIHPGTRVRDVSDAKLTILHREIRYVLNLSIEKGGSTDRNYVNAEGKKGSYIDFARVFRQEGKPCPRHPETLVIKIRVAGRGTHICPKCQILNKPAL